MKNHLLITALLVSSSLHAQPVSTSVQREVLKYQDLRSARELLGYMTHKNSAIRVMAIVAAGSVQDTSHIPMLVKLLTDPDAGVRGASAFALGQMNAAVDSVKRRELSDRIIASLRTERSKGVRLRLIEALGKAGDGLSLDSLLNDGLARFKGEEQSEALLSIGRYAYRGIRTPRATQLAAGALGSQSWQAAYALWRVGDKVLLSEHGAALSAAASSPSADVRMFVASALGRIADESALEALARLSAADTDWRVRVNAVKALARFDSAQFSQSIPLLLRGVGDTAAHVSLSAVSSLGDIDLEGSGWREAVRKTLVGVLVTAPRADLASRREAALALAKLLGDDAYPILADKHDGGILEDNPYAEALGYIPTVDAIGELLPFANGRDSHLQHRALESLLRIVNVRTPVPEVLGLVQNAFLEALQSDDVAVLTSAANGLADSLVRDNRTVGRVMAALERLKRPEQSDAIVALIETLEKLGATEALPLLENLTGSGDRNVAAQAALSLERMRGKSSGHILARRDSTRESNPDWTLLDWLRARPVMQVRTSKGSFTVTLTLDAAPLTCVNFASLAAKGFYDGLTFHRVVPNFVVQGGDPRGDGWGGPGYSIRSEFSSATYDRGTVGMASSGKDTEGSQFFITQSKQPHLDGRYSVFGKVTTGMEVVDRLLVGDKILGVSFAAGVPPARGK